MPFKNAVFSFSTPNLGDDVQAIAAALLLPSVDTYVDRDRLDKTKLSEPHRLIMNSWFAIKRYKAIPNENIRPIYFGQCVGREDLLNPVWISEWKRHQPIGCRDTKSVSTLTSLGIDAHFTGCVTTYMGRFFKAPVSRSGVLFVDVPACVERHIPDDIRTLAVRITNETANPDASPKERFRSAAKLLDALRSAEMVVTRRLHTALPCIGFETPVTVYLNNDPKNRGRFSGSDQLLPMIFHDKDGGVTGPSWKAPSVPNIPSEMERHFHSLVATLGSNVERRWESVAEFVETLPDRPREETRSWKRLFWPSSSYSEVNRVVASVKALAGTN
jgi:hypothetical protein